jgi:hypothetical protein
MRNTVSSYYSWFARVWPGMQLATSRPPGQNCKILRQKKKLADIIIFLYGEVQPLEEDAWREDVQAAVNFWCGKLRR